MALKIPVPDSAWSEISVTLGGQAYDITFRFNDRDIEEKHWRMDIYQDNTPVLLGIRISPYIPLLSRYRLDLFDHGELICVRMFKGEDKLTRNNFGIGKTYELVYYSNEELLAELT